MSWWPAPRIEAGDWTPAIWRSPELAESAYRYANNADMRSIKTAGLSAQATGRQLRGSFEPAAAGTPGSFPILKSKGADSQTTIHGAPDEHWIPKNRDEGARQLNGGTYPEADRILEKAGHLLVSAGQRTNTARLTATANEQKYVGNGWMPVTGLSVQEAKAIAVFINSTAGRLQLMRTPGKTLDFPTYSVAEADNILIPNVKDARIRGILANCWERTKDMEVPQFRDGECEVRRLWDGAVADAMGWNVAELARLRNLLHQEPHVRGLGYNQYADEPQVENAEREPVRHTPDQREDISASSSNNDQESTDPATAGRHHSDPTGNLERCTQNTYVQRLQQALLPEQERVQQSFVEIPTGWLTTEQVRSGEHGLQCVRCNGRITCVERNGNKHFQHI